MAKKNIEAKVSESAIRFFCMENGNNIVGCDWYKTKHCLETCRFYRLKVTEASGEYFGGSAENGTKAK